MPERQGGGRISVPSGDSEAARICWASLSKNDIRFDILPDRNFGGGCRAVGAVKLVDYGVPTTNLTAMTCPLANHFATWVRFAVRPAARQYFDRDLVKVETFGTYSCRRVGGTGKLSEHASANAVDVSAFVLDGGRRITVLGGWNGDERERKFLRAIHDSACSRFGTTLGPDYNAAHRDHLHLDMAQGRFCR